jgi:hypothetical protein
MPAVATEWTVEARAGGVCVVRVVHSLFATTDDWDNQLEGTEFGWPGFFRILRLYLMHFRGQRSAIMQWNAMPPGSPEEAWETLVGTLGLSGVAAGHHWTASPGNPSLSGVLEPGDQYPLHAMIRLDKPCPGIADFGAANCSGMVMATISFYLYGDQAAAVAEREKPQWQAWVDKLFPAPADAGTSG